MATVRPGIFRCCGKVASWGIPWREFCDGVVQAQIARERDERLWLIGTQFGLTLLLIVAMLHWRLVLPVRQLVAQARAPAERRLLRPFLGGVRMSWGNWVMHWKPPSPGTGAVVFPTEQQNQAPLAELGQRGDHQPGAGAQPASLSGAGG